MSSYIKYISSYVKKRNQKLIDDKESIGVIMTKLIELERFDLFYRLMEDILKITSLDGFYNSGYLRIVMQGTGIIAGKSVQALRTAMVFIFKLTY